MTNLRFTLFENFYPPWEEEIENRKLDSKKELSLKESFFLGLAGILSKS
jgi:hypothetical protein